MRNWLASVFPNGARDLGFSAHTKKDFSAPPRNDNCDTVSRGEREPASRSPQRPKYLSDQLDSMNRVSQTVKAVRTVGFVALAVTAILSCSTTKTQPEQK